MLKPYHAGNSGGEAVATKEGEMLNGADTGSLDAPPIHVLIIEDNPEDAVIISECLASERHYDFVVSRADDLVTGTAILDKSRVDVVLLDLSLPDSHGLDTVIRLRRHSSRIPIVVLTGLDDDRIGVGAVKEGAQDYLLKDEVTSHALSRSIQYAIERSRLDRLKDDLISIITHEIRTPLTVIQGCVDNLKDGGAALTKAQAELADIMQRNVDFLSHVIENMLNLARVESGRAKLLRRRLRPEQFVRECIRNFQFQSGRRKISLEEQIDASAPDIEGDDGMLQEVVANLIDNALRFARTKVRVTVARHPAAALRPSGVSDDSATMDGVLISVVDDGEGVPASDLGLLFNKFVQVKRSATAKRYKGTGLGLALSKKIVELHGGHIWAESVQGEGATVSFVLPRAN